MNRMLAEWNMMWNHGGGEDPRLGCGISGDDNGDGFGKGFCITCTSEEGSRETKMSGEGWWAGYYKPIGLGVRIERYRHAFGGNRINSSGDGTGNGVVLDIDGDGGIISKGIYYLVLETWRRQ